MLNVTLRRRIAVAVISILGASLMSTVSIQSSNAAARTFADNATNITLANNKMYVAILTAATAVASNTISSNATKSLASSISYNDGTAGGTDQTLTMRADGTLSLYTGAPSNNLAMFVASGGTFSSAVADGGTPALARNGSNTAQYSAATTSTSVLWTPGAAGSYTVSLYTGTGVDATFASLTGGTKVSEIAVTVLPSNSFFSVAGIYCQAFNSSGVPTTTQTDMVAITMPKLATITVTSTNASDQVTVGTPGVITSATNTITDGGSSVPLTTVRSSSATITATNTGSFKINLAASGALTTVTDTLSVTVVASCSNSTVSMADSFVENQTGTGSTANDNVDDVSRWSNAQTARIATLANNAYAAAVPVGTWIVSATNGAVVGIASGGDATCGATSTASVNGTGADIRVAVCQGTDYAPQTSTVTLTYGSQTVWSRSVLITGDLAKLTVSSVKNIKNDGNAQYGAFGLTASDSAGNQINWAAAAITVSGFNQDVTSGDVETDGTNASLLSSGAFSAGNQLVCASGSKGSATLTVKGTASSGATISSDSFTVNCGGAVRTWKASLDKAQYAPGDLATLTIEASDISGRPVFDVTWSSGANALTAGSTGRTLNALGATTLHTLAGSNMTVVAAPAAADIFVGGKKTYQFVVGATEGSYQLSVNLPDYVSTQAAQAVAYKIKSSTVIITDAEVYASIVKLIAAINKQIRALQKSLRR